MDKKYTKIVDKVISGLDWDAIFEVNKSFKIGVGEGTQAISGIKRKAFSPGITKNDYKAELKYLLKHVIENDIAELFYGTWMIFWTNSDWVQIESDITFDDSSEDDGIPQIQFEIDSTLEVIFSPQRIMVLENSSKGGTINEDSDVNRLESMLKKALDQEKYELASKIRDIIILQKGEPYEDK
jgi:hypothetical protein